MRFIQELSTGTRRARIYKLDGEFIVKFYEGSNYFSEADYFTDSKEDALGTAKVWIQ